MPTTDLTIDATATICGAMTENVDDKQQDSQYKDESERNDMNDLTENVEEDKCGTTMDMSQTNGAKALRLNLIKAHAGSPDLQTWMQHNGIVVNIYKV